MLSVANIETALPAVITKINGNGTIDCKTCIRKVEPNGIFDYINGDIRSVPMMKLGGANAEFTFPNKEGDQVLLICLSRDSSKWKKSGDDDVVPSSATGLTLNDFVAVPIILDIKESAAKIKVTEDGDIELTPARGRKTIFNSDIICIGKMQATDEVDAKVQYVDGTVIDSAAIHLSSHKHPTSVGPTGDPVPGL